MSDKLFRVVGAVPAAQALSGATAPAIIEVYEEIGKDWFTQEGIGAKEFAEALKEIPESQPIVVAINSPGGNVYDGLAIYHMLKRRKDVTCRIDGVAASIASVIAMAGTLIEMPANSLLMVHNPWTMAVGNADELRKVADDMDKHRDVMVGIYAERTGLTRERIQQLLDDETWLTGDEAAALGFCDGTTEPLRLAASIRQPHAYQFRCPPKHDAATCVVEMQTHTETRMENTTPVPVANPTPAPDLGAAIAALTAKVEALAAKHAEPAGVAPVAATRFEVIGNSAVETWKKMAAGPERAAFATANMDVIAEHLSETEQARSMNAMVRAAGFPVKAANTITSNLIPAILNDSLITIAVDSVLAPFNTFTRSFTPVPMASKRTQVLPVFSSGSTVLTNASDFEAGNSTVTNVTISTAQYTKPFQVDNNDVQNGFSLRLLAEGCAREFALSLHNQATTLMTVANFGATSITVGAGTTWTSASLQSKLAPVLVAAKNYDQRILLLDGSHLMYLLPTDRNSFAIGELGGWGFDKILQNNDWTGAATNACGFVTNGRAIYAVSGVPEVVAPGDFFSISSQTLRNGMTVATYQWFSRKTRTMWASYDIVLGLTVADSSAGRVLVTS